MRNQIPNADPGHDGACIQGYQDCHRLLQIMESAGIKKSFDASLAIAGNMLAIGGHLLKLKKDSPELHTYLFYKHLLNLLGFVHGGLKLWKESTGLDDPKLKNDKPKLARLLEDLQKILGAIDDGIDWDKGSWEVQRVSAIWLLIEVMYKTTESTPTTIGEEQECLPIKHGPF